MKPSPTTENDPCSPVQIGLWLAYYHEFGSPLLHTELRTLLTDVERAQEARFHFADDRLRYLVTRAMVRTVLSRYAMVAPGSWEFVCNAYGRPELAPGFAAHDLRFNISHTRGLIALAVTRGRAIGVDVENTAVREAPLGVAEHFFAPAEVAELSALAPDRRPDRFFDYWTLKEAYIKARGMGLSLPLDRFSFHFPAPDAVRLVADAELDEDSSRWNFLHGRPAPGYLLALCVEHAAGPAPLVHARRIVPAARDWTDSAVGMEWLRRSSDPARR